MERFHTFYLPCLFSGKGCQTPFNQTAYRTAKTTISCDKRNNSGVMFFCKENGSICEDISNGSFTLPETSSSFNMSISNVSSQHAGVYWCGVETDKGSNRAALRKIQLEVEGEKQTSDTFRFDLLTDIMKVSNTLLNTVTDRQLSVYNCLEKITFFLRC